MSCTLTRTRLPSSSAEPSSTASTLSSRAISGTESSECLYFIADVREMTRSALMRDRSEMIASVMPSTKYSCVGSPATLRRGSTAIARMRSGAGSRCADDDDPSLMSRSAFPTSAADSGRCSGSLRKQSESSASSAAGMLARSERADGAAVLMMANMSASARSFSSGRRPVTISKSRTPKA